MTTKTPMELTEEIEREKAIVRMMHATDFLPHGHFIIEFDDGTQKEFEHFSEFGAFLMKRERAALRQSARREALLRRWTEAEVDMSDPHTTELFQDTVRELRGAEERAKATGEDGLVELSKRIRGAINNESNTGIHPRKVFAGMPEDWKLILDSLDARQAYWTVLECLFERFPDCPVIGDLPGWVDELKAENESAEAQVSELQQKLLDEMDIGNDLARRADAAEARAKANQEDAEKYRLLRMNTGKEYNVSTYGVPHALRITFDANGCEKYLPDGTLNFPKTLDAILDDERKIRSTWTHSAARGAKP